MFRYTKKLILAVIESFEEGDSQDENGQWRILDDSIKISANALLEMWQAYRLNGILPQDGGWLDQPLSLLVRIGAIDMIARTWEEKNRDNADWSNFSIDQINLIAWAEEELT